MTAGASGYLSICSSDARCDEGEERREEDGEGGRWMEGDWTGCEKMGWDWMYVCVDAMGWCSTQLRERKKGVRAAARGGWESAEALEWQRGMLS